MQGLRIHSRVHIYMTEKRIRFYMVHASADENQNGIYHRKGFVELWEALEEAEKTKDDFVVIEKHHERRDPPPSGFVYRKPENEWEVDHNAGGIEVIDG